MSMKTMRKTLGLAPLTKPKSASKRAAKSAAVKHAGITVPVVQNASVSDVPSPPPPSRLKLIFHNIPSAGRTAMLNELLVFYGCQPFVDPPRPPSPPPAPTPAPTPSPALETLQPQLIPLPPPTPPPLPLALPLLLIQPRIQPQPQPYRVSNRVMLDLTRLQAMQKFTRILSGYAISEFDIIGIRTAFDEVLQNAHLAQTIDLETERAIARIVFNKTLAPHSTDPSRACMAFDRVLQSVYTSDAVKLELVRTTIRFEFKNALTKNHTLHNNVRDDAYATFVATLLTIQDKERMEIEKERGLARAEREQQRRDCDERRQAENDVEDFMVFTRSAESPDVLHDRINFRPFECKPSVQEKQVDRNVVAFMQAHRPMIKSFHEGNKNHSVSTLCDALRPAIIKSNFDVTQFRLPSV